MAAGLSPVSASPGFLGHHRGITHKSPSLFSQGGRALFTALLTRTRKNSIYSCSITTLAPLTLLPSGAWIIHRLVLQEDGQSAFLFCGSIGTLAQTAPFYVTAGLKRLSFSSGVAQNGHSQCLAGIGEALDGLWGMVMPKRPRRGY
jgi:hypothetical protein